jgi:hypothetical protein
VSSQNYVFLRWYRCNSLPIFQTKKAKLMIDINLVSITDRKFQKQTLHSKGLVYVCSMWPNNVSALGVHFQYICSSKTNAGYTSNNSIYWNSVRVNHNVMVLFSQPGRLLFYLQLIIIATIVMSRTNLQAIIQVYIRRMVSVRCW